MSDSLRDRIAAVIRDHVEDQLTNYDAGRNECGCGTQGLSGYREHLADAVIAVMREEKAVKNVAFKPPLVYTYGSPEAAIHDFNRAPSYVQQDLRLVHRYVTEWMSLTDDTTGDVNHD